MRRIGGWHGVRLIKSLWKASRTTSTGCGEGGDFWIGYLDPCVGTQESEGNSLPTPLARENVIHVLTMVSGCFEDVRYSVWIVGWLHRDCEKNPMVRDECLSCLRSFLRLDLD